METELLGVVGPEEAGVTLGLVLQMVARTASQPWEYTKHG